MGRGKKGDTGDAPSKPGAGSAARTPWGTALIALVASVFACEVLCRLVVAEPPGSFGRVWMLSSPSFLLDQFGAVRYRPDERVRTLAIYDGTVEYDVRYRTNDMGFIDDEDYGGRDPEASIGYAFVGDSFTAGIHGGRPWIPKLRRELRRTCPSLDIYNFGIEGTGLRHFERLLAEMRDLVRIDEIVILAISDDFQRPFWFPEASPGEIRFCDPRELAECKRQQAIAVVVDGAASSQELRARARAIAEASMSREGTVARIKAMAKQSFLVREAVSTWRAARAARAARLNEKENLAALGGLSERFRGMPISLIHLPQKQEVVAGMYKADVRRFVEDAAVRYVPALHECPWNAEMFYRADSHPNARGYRAIRSCIRRFVRAPVGCAARRPSG
jgi:hypothetical protein